MMAAVPPAEACLKWCLVTGFGPFAHHTDNPSWLAVQRLPDVVHAEGHHGPEPIALVKKHLPVEYEAADRLYDAELPSGSLWGASRTAPALIVHVGVNGNTRHVDLEQTAVNTAPKADVRGKQAPCDCKVTAEEAAGCKVRTRLDLRCVARAVAARCHVGGQAADVRVSSDAGTFLCNYVFYRACKWTAGLWEQIETGRGCAACAPHPHCLFVHVPEEGKPYSVAQLTSILRAAVEECLPQTGFDLC